MVLKNESEGCAKGESGCSDVQAPKSELRVHWDKAYSSVATNQLGWYEEDPEPSLSLIKKADLQKDQRQLHVGVGSSLLIDKLIDLGHKGVIASDISPKAMDIMQERLGGSAEKVQWIVDDLAHPKALPYLEPIDLWHDRAVLHFLMKKEEQKSYFDLIRRLVKPGGHVIIGVFNLHGADSCSGLPVLRYDHRMIAECIGDDFELIDHFNYSFINPRAEDRPYVYTLFKRKST